MLAWLLTCLVSLTAVLNPVGAVPLLLTMTAGDPAWRRRRTAVIAAVTQTACLLAVAVGGTWLFAFFGITVDSLRIAGGALLFLLAVDMVRVAQSRHKATEAEIQAGVERQEVGIIPLGIPMLAGPGAIATTVSLAGQAAHLPWGEWLLAAAVLGVGLFTAVILLAAQRLQRWLTPTVLGVASRLVGLLLAAIGAQMLVAGLRNALVGLSPASGG